jgi:hypothetical protein
LHERNTAREFVGWNDELQTLNKVLRAAFIIDEMAGWLIRLSMEIAKNSSTIVSM